MPIGNVPPPTQHPDEEPIICIPINVQWIPILLGALVPLKYPEYWAGTLEENRTARKDYGTLIDQIMQEEFCGEMTTCCEPTIYIYRLNPDTGAMERSKDDGATWTTDPADPIHTIVKQPPLVTDTSGKTKCDAATNFSEHFNDIITDCSENLGTATTVVELAGGIAALLLDIFIIIVTEGAGIAIVTTITASIFAGISAAFVEGKAAFDAYWTSDRKDQILCAAFDTIGENGQFSQTQWEDFKHRARLELTPSPALDMVLTSANAAGYVGGTNMASYGAAAEADCASCTPACLVDNWTTVGAGTELSRTSDTVTIQAGFDGTHYSVAMETSTVSPWDQCCRVNPSATVGSIDLPFGYILCGNDNTNPGNIVFPLGNPDQCNFVFITSSAPFTAVLTFTP